MHLFCTLDVNYVLVTCSHCSVFEVNVEHLFVEMMLKDNTKMSLPRDMLYQDRKAFC